MFHHIGKPDPKPAAVTKVALNRLCQMTLSQDYFLYLMFSEVPYDVLQERFIEHRDQSLGRVAGEGLQSGSFPSYKDNCFHYTVDFTIIHKISYKRGFASLKHPTL